MNKKVLMLILSSIGAVAVVAVIGFIIAASLGYVYVGTKKPSDSVGGQSVCTNDIVKKYNDALKQQDSKDIDKALETVSAEITKKPNYKESPNCVYMQLTYAMGADKVDDVRELGRTLKDLGAKGKYTTGELYNAMSLETITGMVDQFSGGSSSELPAGNG